MRMLSDRQGRNNMSECWCDSAESRFPRVTLWARSQHAGRQLRRRLSGVKQTQGWEADYVGSDPKPTSAPSAPSSYSIRYFRSQSALF